MSKRRTGMMARISTILWLVFLAGTVAPGASADEGGVSFWLPGQYGSFAAVAPTPGFSLPTQSYCYSGNAGGNTTLDRGGSLSLGLDADFCGQFFVPTWTPDITVLGARPSFSLAFFPGWSFTTAEIDRPGRERSRSDDLVGFGDLYPTAQLFWNKGVHNWMTYVTGDIPVGSYNPDRLSNLGIGHAAIDVGGAYTYLDTSTGWEFSATAGVTYNFENPKTDYTNGIDFHLDAGMSRFINEKLFVGLVGYAYVQLTPDKGQPLRLGSMESRTFAVGPQIGYNFDFDGVPIYTNLRAYYEFGAKNRTEGGSIFLTVNIPLSSFAKKREHD